MLVELSLVEQRYHAVLEVLVSRVPVSEVADRYGCRVSRCTPGCAAMRLAPAASSAAAGLGGGGG
jgi:hypothetical protein